MDNVNVLTHNSTYLNQIIAELRDEEIQKDRLRFRTNLEKAGEILAYEISKDFNYLNQTVYTPLGTDKMALPQDKPILCSILRAAIPFHNGFLRMLDQADNGFISAYRHHTAENEFEIKLEYLAAPDLEGKPLILVDPMIATGRSIVISHEALVKECGTPSQTFIAGVIASEEGIEHVKRNIRNCNIYLGAMDGELTAKSYIVPGLGDAGDLAFGNK